MKHLNKFKLKTLTAKDQKEINGGNEWRFNSYGQGISAAEYLIREHANNLFDFNNHYGVYYHGLYRTENKACYHRGFMSVVLQGGVRLGERAGTYIGIPIPPGDC